MGQCRRTPEPRKEALESVSTPVAFRVLSSFGVAGPRCWSRLARRVRAIADTTADPIRGGRVPSDALPQLAIWNLDQRLQNSTVVEPLQAANPQEHPADEPDNDAVGFTPAELDGDGPSQATPLRAAGSRSRGGAVRWERCAADTTAAETTGPRRRRSRSPEDIVPVGTTTPAGRRRSNRSPSDKGKASGPCPFELPVGRHATHTCHATITPCSDNHSHRSPRRTSSVRRRPIPKRRPRLLLANGP